jgi:hypothetical protein
MLADARFSSIQTHPRPSPPTPVRSIPVQDKYKSVGLVTLLTGYYLHFLVDGGHRLPNPLPLSPLTLPHWSLFGKPFVRQLPDIEVCFVCLSPLCIAFCTVCLVLESNSVSTLHAAS